LFDDRQLVGLSLDFGPERALLSTGVGIITNSSCAVGDTVNSGQSLFAINGVPSISMATSIPMWRDIGMGDSGIDVQAMSHELVRLGWFKGDVSELATRNLIRAFKQMAKEAGTPNNNLSDGFIYMNNVSWLPSDSLRLASCPVGMGASITQGEVLAIFEPHIVSARIAISSTRLVQGARNITIDDVTLSVNSDGSITDSQALLDLASSPIVDASITQGSTDSIQVIYTLVEPLNVSVIPPASIRPQGASLGCVIGDGKPMPVTIVSSELGQSFVTFAGKQPHEVAINPPHDLKCSE
jgi:hypothetical protein